MIYSQQEPLRMLNVHIATITHNARLGLQSILAFSGWQIPIYLSVATAVILSAEEVNRTYCMK